MENIGTDKVHMTTLNEVITHLKERGFSHEFNINSNGEMTSTGAHSFKPTEVKIIEFFRFEGESDPGDESILYALETDNGTKGVLSHIYGREASEENQYASNFIKKVRSLHEEHPLSTGNYTEPNR